MTNESTGEKPRVSNGNSKVRPITRKAPVAPVNVDNLPTLTDEQREALDDNYSVMPGIQSDEAIARRDAAQRVDDAAPSLLPCPFCGAKDHDLVRRKNRHFHVIRCDGCGANKSENMTWLDAVSAWNTREHSELSELSDVIDNELVIAVDALSAFKTIIEDADFTVDVIVPLIDTIYQRLDLTRNKLIEMLDQAYATAREGVK